MSINAFNGIAIDDATDILGAPRASVDGVAIASSGPNTYFYTTVSAADSVINFGNGPASIDDEIIEMIQLRVGEDGLVKLDDELNEGDPVMIDSGPLQHLSGVFQHDIKGTDRVAILLTAISFQGRVIIERDLVKKIV